MIGIDFGTTNTSIARATGDGVETVRFPSASGDTEAYRSLLYLEKAAGSAGVKCWTGPAAIEQYLEADTKGRLIQSLKSFLSSRSLQSTEVFGRRHALEELIARILRDVREAAERALGEPVRAAVVGRPVQFVGAETEGDNEFAQSRLEAAFGIAGFEEVRFEMEPVAASSYYESTLDHDELILIGDFGGGTSDFSLVRVGPSVRQRGRTPDDLLGNAGVGVAGDAFDARIVHHLVSPALGMGSEIRSMGRMLPAPSWVYTKLERWHHLSLLRSRDVLNMLRTVERQAVEPQKIAGLLHLIQEDLGYQLHRAVQKLKCELSEQTAAEFAFDDGVIELRALVRREEFEEWIGEELSRIAGCVDGLLENSGVRAADVDQVFLTGGSSFVPAVRRVFAERFGEGRIRAGNEFTSVARGLALTA